MIESLGYFAVCLLTLGAALLPLYLQALEDLEHQAPSKPAHSPADDTQ